MRLIWIAAFLLAAAGCNQSNMIDAQGAKRWSASADVQNRTKPSVYSYLRSDRTWVCISTARLKETATTVAADSGNVLTKGFIVYPGGTEAETISDAITIAAKIPRGLPVEK